MPPLSNRTCLQVEDAHGQHVKEVKMDPSEYEERPGIRYAVLTPKRPRFRIPDSFEGRRQEGDTIGDLPRCPDVSQWVPRPVLPPYQHIPVRSRFHVDPMSMRPQWNPHLGRPLPDQMYYQMGFPRGPYGIPPQGGYQGMPNFPMYQRPPPEWAVPPQGHSQFNERMRPPSRDSSDAAHPSYTQSNF
ncbi:acidic proline-rich protein PRP33-like [Octopus sinensis]|uniref:Acidic proline-rich protein PRP33-like n=1 Tax=Octopus sinensis TaxID=2607531 RepID=A0A6P7U335_9MOLL|nr:acidic proline-rich protein PRP33-like [Octopus sinensis]